MKEELRNIELLISKHKEMIDRLEELKMAIIHEEQKSRFVPGETVSFSKEKLNKFKGVYKTAVSGEMGSFWFDGNEYLTAYAKHMIEYLDNQFAYKA